jgi:hypothetical protein
MAVAPDNPDETYFLCATFNHSMDGGYTLTSTGRGGGGGRGRGGAAPATEGGRGAPPAPAFTSPGGDNHDIWIDPTNPSRMVVGNDAGVHISTTRGRAWLHVNLPIAQIYHATVDNRVPYYVYGNKQDGPSYRGPSNSRAGGAISRSEWHAVQGGESGWATPDPVDPNIIWSTASGSGSRGGIVVRFDERTRTGQNVEVWPLSTGGHSAADVEYRFVWDAPFAISPHDHNTIYTGSQFVHMSKDGGRSWRVISPDLTRNDKSKQQSSGGLTPDNIGVEYGDVVYAIAESRAQAGVIWAGTNDGLVQVTRDAGKTWTNVTATVPGILPWGSVRHIEPSKYDAGSAYIIVDGHQENNRDPWVYRTKDFGKTWKLIVTGIPHSVVSYAHIIREDPVRRGLLYLGTEGGLFVSFDDGDHWQPMQLGMPHAPVYGLVVQEHFNDLVVATYGRGFFILDDLSPLQKLTPEVAASPATLFAPRAAYRFRDIEANVAPNDDPTAGANPPYGADINYWLGSAGGTASVAILDAAGKTVRTIQGTTRAGLNRVYWDLSNEPSKTARMRTKPLYDAEFRMDADGTRPATALDMTASAELLKKVQADMTTSADMLLAIESVRAQLDSLAAQIGGNSSMADVRAQGDSVGRKFVVVEGSLIDVRMTGRGQDEVRYPAKLGAQLNYLAGGIAASDFAPAAQQQKVGLVLAKQVRDTHAALQSLINTDLAKFNTLLRSRGLKTIDATVPALVF